MDQILIEAKHLSETSAAAGQPNVTPRAARRIRTRYHQTLNVALHLLPDGPPPPRRHTAGKHGNNRLDALRQLFTTGPGSHPNQPAPEQLQHPSDGGSTPAHFRAPTEA
jgi:hypothetical protein